MEMSDEWNPKPAGDDSPNDEREISLLEAFDRAVASLPRTTLPGSGSSPSAPRLPRRKRWWATRAR